MRKRNRLMAAMAAAAAALSIVIPAAAANAAPPDSWSAIGQVTPTGTCADNVATFGVNVPTVGIDAEMEGGFSINGTNANVETFAVGVISPFTRSVTVPVDTLPATFTVSYWLNTTAETLFVQEYTFDATCDSTPPVVTPTLDFTLTPSADGSGVDYVVTVGPDNVPLPQTVIIGYGAQDVAKELTFTEAGTQTGSFPWAPCGTYVFGVFIPDSPIGDSEDVTIPCPNPGGGGDNPGDNPGDGGNNGGTPDNGGTTPDTNTGGTPDKGTTPPVKTAPPAAQTGDVVEAQSPLGYGLMGGGALLIAALVALVAVRSRKSSAITR